MGKNPEIIVTVIKTYAIQKVFIARNTVQYSEQYATYLC
jgi:hypothetical protein